MKLLKKHHAINVMYLISITVLLHAFLLADCGTTDSGELINLEGSWSSAGLEEIRGYSDLKLNRFLLAETIYT